MGIVGKIFKKSKLSGLLILAVLLSGNIFAWFIYTTKVDSSIRVHVRGWDISFEAGNTNLSQTINFDLDEIYPGMTTYNDTITATNNGEGTADFAFELVSATILGTTYTVTPTLTSEELTRQLASDYPFAIVLAVSNPVINANGGTGEFSLTVSWPYESGNDESDTYWGGQAYEFHSTNSEEPSISIVAVITASQST